MQIELIAPHPTKQSVSWSTSFSVEMLNDSIIFIRDTSAKNSKAVSVTNNMEQVLMTICRAFGVREYELGAKFTSYQVGEDGVFKIKHKCCINPEWIYMGPDDKALRVLYGTKE